MEQGELRWLLALGVFDVERSYELDGSSTTASWLVTQLRMARTTAHEKVRVARALRRRPVLAEAFADGRISYCALRAISRAEGTSEELDRLFVEQAEERPVATIEAMVRRWQLLGDQDRPPADLDPRRSVTLWRGLFGLGRAEMILSDVEIDELDAAITAFAEETTPTDGDGRTAGSHAGSDAGDGRPDSEESPREDTALDAAGLGDGGDGAGGDDRAEGDEGAGSSSRGDSRPPYRVRRADAFMALVRAGVAALRSRGSGGGADRYLINLVFGADGSAQTLAGEPVDPATAARIACDAQVIAHRFAPDGGGPLSQGRRSRVWSTAQRRAIFLRDGGACRFPGCANHHVDAHHLRPWASGGATDVTNGLNLCPRHHTLVHSGWSITGDPSGALAFRRPDGVTVGTTRPVRA